MSEALEGTCPTCGQSDLRARVAELEQSVEALRNEPSRAYRASQDISIQTLRARVVELEEKLSGQLREGNEFLGVAEHTGPIRECWEGQLTLTPNEQAAIDAECSSTLDGISAKLAEFNARVAEQREAIKSERDAANARADAAERQTRLVERGAENLLRRTQQAESEAASLRARVAELERIGDEDLLNRACDERDAARKDRDAANARTDAAERIAENRLQTFQATSDSLGKAIVAHKRAESEVERLRRELDMVTTWVAHWKGKCDERSARMERLQRELDMCDSSKLEERKGRFRAEGALIALRAAKGGK